MTTLSTSREHCAERDRTDPLAPLRQRFHIPSGVLYFDGNSLGPLPVATREHVLEVMEKQWGERLIRSWNEHGWIHWPRKVGATLAGLVGAAPEEVVVADSTSVNLFKLLAAALELRPGRRTILTDQEHFPTDLYMVQGLGELCPGLEVRQVPRGEIEAALDDSVAVVSLSHVDFKTGDLLDMAAYGEMVHAHGALTLWDLSHSAGALPVKLGRWGADLAVGCGYKFLNGGPGAPAFLYVSKEHQEAAKSPLWGWLGHSQPFAFEKEYRPAQGIDRFQCGTPPILSLAALSAGLEPFEGVSLEAVRRKSMDLGELFLALMAERCQGLGLEVACPTDPQQRGSQVCLRHDEGYAIVQALIERGVIGDFRVSDVLRFGLTPLYLRFVDVWDAVEILRQIMVDRAWDEPRFRRRLKVT